MGLLNCHFQCHYYPDKEVTYNIPIQNNRNNIDNENNKLIHDFFKTIDRNNLFFDDKKFSNLISEKILCYMKNNRLNYKSFQFSILNLSKYNPFELSDGNIFFGDIKYDYKMEGYGIYIINDKKVIVEGIWKKGCLIYGRIFFSNDDIYEGEISQSLPNGVGKFIFENGDIYKGDFILGEITGKGIYIFNDKTYYCGYIKNGVFNGEGSMSWINGDEYHGTFSDSTLNNKGKIFNDLLCEKYTGFFENNEFHGKGIYRYQNGDIYEGNFEYGIRRGNGKYKMKNGFEFSGMWDRDTPNGEGIISCEKFTIKGIWKDGIKNQILELLEGNNSNIDLKNIDLNIKTSKRQIIPSSLSHLNINDKTVISQYVLTSDVNEE